MGDIGDNIGELVRLIEGDISSLDNSSLNPEPYVHSWLPKTLNPEREPIIHAV